MASKKGGKMQCYKTKCQIRIKKNRGKKIKENLGTTVLP